MPVVIGTGGRTEMTVLVTGVPPSTGPLGAIVPIRSWSAAKSRLALPHTRRELLSRAFALDVVEVLAASPEVGLVVVVTADPVVRATLADCDVVDDAGTGVNDAVNRGRERAVLRGCQRVVVVPSDLPCLTVDALREVLTLSAPHRHAFCPDTGGDGTSIVVSQDPANLATAYGPGSASAHQASGLMPLPAAPARARRDVDTVEHLRVAEALGVGRHTAAAVAAFTDRVEPPR